MSDKRSSNEELPGDAYSQLGVSSNATFEEGIISEKLPTDYIAIGSLFETNSKKIH